jgi:predicted ribosomally synthesized peptide with SipW-like signal peptide
MRFQKWLARRKKKKKEKWKKKEKKNKFLKKKMKLKTFLKTTLLFCIVLTLPMSTYAFFSDSETSENNTFSAGTLQTEIHPSIPIEEHINAYENTEFSLELRNLGSLDNENELFFSEINNESFAEKIWVVVEKNGSTYEGYLNNFQINESWFQSAGEKNTISFSFSISEEDFLKTSGENISFKIENYASQHNLPYGSGFHDKDQIEITLVNSSAILKSVIYEGMCDEHFGTDMEDRIIFEFSGTIFHNSQIAINFEKAQRLWEGWSADQWHIEDNKATVTLKRLYQSPRNLQDEYVTKIEGLYDSMNNPVFVPSSGVEIETNVSGLSIVDVDASSISFNDNKDGTGTLETTLVNICGTRILPENFPVVPETSTYENPSENYQNYFRTNATSKNNNHFYYIGASHFPASEGFTRANHIGNGVYTHSITKPYGYEDTWEIGIGPWLHEHDVFVLGEVEIKIDAQLDSTNSVTYISNNTITLENFSETQDEQEKKDESKSEEEQNTKKESTDDSKPSVEDSLDKEEKQEYDEKNNDEEEIGIEEEDEDDEESIVIEF